MKLLFTKTVNDANNAGKAFFAGRTYELSEARAKQIMSAVPDAVKEVKAFKVVEEAVRTGEEPKKKSKKEKKAQEEPTPEEDLGFIETSSEE